MHETAPGLEFGNKVYRVRFDGNYSDKVLNYESLLLSTTTTFCTYSFIIFAVKINFLSEIIFG